MLFGRQITASLRIAASLLIWQLRTPGRHAVRGAGLYCVQMHTRQLTLQQTEQQPGEMQSAAAP
jgi:hypothetical protein